MAKNDYFEQTLMQMNYCTYTSDLLCHVLKDKYIKDISQSILKLDDISKQSERFYNETKDKLSKEFITPLEHNDFLILLQSITNIQKEIKNIFDLLNVYHIYDVSKCLNELSVLLNDTTISLTHVLYDLKNYKKSDKLRLLMLEAKSFSILADKKYKEGIEELISKTYDYKKIISYHKIYDYFIRCFELCIYTNDMIEQIIMRNT